MTSTANNNRYTTTCFRTHSLLLESGRKFPEPLTVQHRTRGQTGLALYIGHRRIHRSGASAGNTMIPWFVAQEAIQKETGVLTDFLAISKFTLQDTATHVFSKFTTALQSMPTHTACSYRPLYNCLC